MIRLRWAIVGLWLVVLVLGNYAAFGLLPDRLVNELTVPGTESERARAILVDKFGDREVGSYLVVAKLQPGQSAETAAAVKRALSTRLKEAATAVPTAEAGPVQAAGADVLFANITSDLHIEQAQRQTRTIRRIVHGIPGARVYVSGSAAINADIWPIALEDMARGEGIAIPIALMVLLAVFGLSLAVVMPFLLAACSIGATLGIVFLASYQLAMPQQVINLVQLVGLGVAIDYSLLIVYRFREEIDKGGDKEAAILRTMRTAGRAVVFSGATVAIGLGLLLLVPIPFLQAVGLGAFLIPLLSIAAVLTLQPALLSLFSRRSMGRAPLARMIRRVFPPLPRFKGTRDVDDGMWGRLAHTIMKRPLIFAALGTIVLLGAAAPALSLRLTPGSMTSMPHSPESIQGYDILSQALGPGALGQTQIVVDSRRPGGAESEQIGPAIERLTIALRSDPEVARATFLPIAPYLDSSGRYARIMVVGRHEYGDPAAERFVHRTRDEAVPQAGFPEEVEVLVGGSPAGSFDFQRRLYEYFPYLVLAVLVLTYLLLMRAFRSLFLPLKAVILNLLSVGAAYGLLVIAFSWGVGHALFGNIYQQDLIESWIPVILFAMLFGLSMDYEVFLVTRMREAWDSGATNEQAVREGLERTGRIVTAAAVIMVAAFSGFVAGRLGTMQEFGFGLAAAILFDATLIRAVLVPSLMALFGRYNWWLPPRFARMLRVPPSPLTPAEPAGPAPARAAAPGGPRGWNQLRTRASSQLPGEPEEDSSP